MLNEEHFFALLLYMDPMSSILVLMRNDQPDERLLEIANRHIRGTDTSAVVCRVYDEDRYQSEIQQNVRSGNDIESVDQLEATAEETAQTIATSVFDDENTVIPIGLAGDLPNDVLELANEYGCTQIFLSGRKRSPVGKAFFGDIAQQILLEFDGPVTIMTNS